MKLSLSYSRKTIIKTINSPRKRTSLQNIQSSEIEGALRDKNLPKTYSENISKGLLPNKKHFAVSWQFFNEAKAILDTVNQKYGCGDQYLEQVFGEQITQTEATKYLVQYLQYEELEGALKIIWSSDIDCCGRIVWTGPGMHLNKPEKRRYSLWLKNTKENIFLRQKGIKGLADHEIGTHYVSMTSKLFFQEIQKQFGLRGLHTKHLKTTEEGLAAINTLLNVNCKLLWWPAFLYYTACKSIEMTFKDLFNHLAVYIRDPNQRWKHVTRVKRHLDNIHGYGGSGKDQVYFAGAVEILRQAKDIDFKLLYSGKLCLNELSRIKRIRRTAIKLPSFMQDINEYRRVLQEMCFINCLTPPTLRNNGIINPITQKATNIKRRKRTARRIFRKKSISRKSEDVLNL